MPGDFDESLHPRADSGKFGEGGGGAAAKTPGRGSADKPAKAERAPKQAKPVSPEDLNKALDALPKANINHSILPPSTMDHVQYNNSLAQVNKNLAPHEHEAVAKYVGDDFAPMRKAQISGKPPDFVEPAHTLNSAMEREMKSSKPINIYRGMEISHEAANQLLTSKTMELKATTSFSLHGQEAMSFAGLGKTGNKLVSNDRISVMIVGKLKAVALPGSPESELVRPASKLRIVSRTVHTSANGAKVLIVHVKDAA